MHWPVGLGGVPGEHGEWADDGGGQAQINLLLLYFQRLFRVFIIKA